MPTLEFKGKQFVYSHHLSVPFRELRVEAAKSLPAQGRQPSLDDNLIIHGDNLEALKALLPTHAGKIDCIFIDPPYNTGNEGWCYNDNVRSPLMQEWLKKSANPVDKEDLERHDKWLCMMWPRLCLLTDLLSENGVIFITIDDNEQHHLRELLDELFGQDCHVASIVWQKRTSPESRKRLGAAHDIIHVYSRHPQSAQVAKLSLTAEQADGFSNPDNDPRGEWVSTDLTAQNIDPSKRKGQQYTITLPNGRKVDPPPGRCWSMLEPEYLTKKQEGRIWFGVNGDARPRIKTYLSESEGLSSWSWWPNEEVGHNQEAKKEIMQILGSDNPFDYPKPKRLLARIIALATTSDSIILDSFAGSGTTAHAVLAANQKDGGNRRFILVECEEYADTLTAERVRRVIDGYAFTGSQRQELYTEKITWSNFAKNHKQILLQVEHFEKKAAASFDKIKKEIKDGVLTVTGERRIEKKVPGLGGSFTFCTLGDAIAVESLLTGQGLPAFDALARYVFYTATGQSLAKVGKPSIDGLIGETELFRIHLIYRPDPVWLRSNEAALNAERVEAIASGRRSDKKRAIVFAVAKFMSQKELTRQRIEFCQLPYAVHRILGD
ncbi:MAG: site-specific DNA-methyltransferase [Proteobacteria bacterium]|nr:site-specific DNA-methyltransferase [Pseudomonadota bacterium]MBU1546081.1 site-specific DNA-methyltransferase [Pseudomonadota bacterium]MBU2619807.1 site-specific DNA-methyltransferase [Pseudomonadota bacterium]